MRDRLSLLRILHPFPSFLVSALTVAIVPLADRDAPLSRYLVLGLGMLLCQFVIGLVNDLVDVDEDRRSKPWKPLARGLMPPSYASAAIGMCALGVLIVTWGLNRSAWLMAFGGLACGLSYDLYFKRTVVSWLPYSIAIPLVPAWVYVASDAWQPLLWWTFPLGTVLGLALNLANESPDAGRGATAGLAGWLGARRSNRFAVALFGLAVCLLAGLLTGISPPRAVATIAVGGVAVVVARWSARLFGHDGLFGVLAVASACLALLFLSAI